MAVHEPAHRTPGFRLPSSRSNHTTPASESAVSAHSGTHAARAYAFASLRLLTGFVFLWAFLDKTFGLGYATPSGKGWIDGGSPTKGFLSSVAAGPMESTFHSWAGATAVDWLFMLGLLGVGVALVAGVALRFAAVAGTLMMAFMWLAEWPLAPAPLGRLAEHVVEPVRGLPPRPRRRPDRPGRCRRRRHPRPRQALGEAPAGPP
jgi:thiosulfate dehydrogenase [quinone] large subunit